MDPCVYGEESQGAEMLADTRKYIYMYIFSTFRLKLKFGIFLEDAPKFLLIAVLPSCCSIRKWIFNPLRWQLVRGP